MKIFLCLFTLLIVSCSHETTRNNVTIATTTKGLVKNSALSNPLFLTSDVNEKDAPVNAIKILQGHFLSIKNAKEVNEKILHDIEENKFHIVNLSLEDIAIAEMQEIKFEDFKKLIFLNSTVSDVTRDDLYKRENVLNYYVFDDVVFIGLSDNQVDKNVNTNRFLINDNVLSILKIKRITKEKNFKTYILIHQLGSDINEIMGRLPPTFINSLAN